MFYTSEAALDHAYQGLALGHAKDFVLKQVRQRGSKRIVWVVRFIYA